MFPTRGLLAVLSAFTVINVLANGDVQTQHEQFDEFLWDRDIFPKSLNCGLRNESSIAAQWIRLAYHDQSTYNASAGTGGLDASIMYELDRHQNIGLGMRLTITDYFPFVHPEVSMSDMIAFGVVLGLPICDGPLIPLRAGRVDATKAGPPLVPEPFQSLESHEESFWRQGYTREEMIKLVACGHTIGGVRKEDGHGAAMNPGLNKFDSTHRFDPKIATKYLDGTTTNPLVVSTNKTVNSDLRIFSSDGNVTISSLTDDHTFFDTCGKMFSKMLDEKIPAGVTLTDPIEPLKYKIGPTRLYPGTAPNDRGFVFQTNVRAWGNKPARSAKLYYNDRVSDHVYVVDEPTLVFRNASANIARLKGLSEHQTYEFLISVDAESSISKFWFEIDEADGSEPVIVNSRMPTNAPLVIEQDSVLYDRGRSDVETGKFVVAIKGDPKQVSVTTFQPVDPLPVRETHQLKLDTSIPSILGYDFYSTTVNPLALYFDITAELGLKTIKMVNIQRSDRGFITL